ncbi:MAG: hypothetical protein H6708_21570 [Kofleriaceae bacterium]|nr:hypothetical protein [Kofleriaceae bacterium]
MVCNKGLVVGGCLLGFTLGLSQGCFDPPADVPFDAAPPDAEVDAPIICTASTTTCENNRYIECDERGSVSLQLTCPLGCDDTEVKCRDVDPSNGVAMYLDRAGTDPDAPDLVLSAGSTIDTDTGIVFDGALSVDVPSTDLGPYRVFIVKSLAVDGNTKVSGGRGVIIVSDGEVEISALLDVSADMEVDGPGAASGACQGSDANAASFPGGGGGGGNSLVGGAGGESNNGASAGAVGGAPHVDVDLDPLVGGCDGGRSIVTGSVCTSGGGGGGGALQIVSRVEIALTGSGSIDASGGGGITAMHGATCPASGNSTRGGGGGGSGGMVLLEAPQVRLEGAAVVVSTKGGSGSAGGVDGGARNGSDGGTGSVAAPGGMDTTQAWGGNGGTEVLPPRAGGYANPNLYGGGGGGSVGQARFNTTSGTINPQSGAALRTQYSTGALRTRLVP